MSSFDLLAIDPELGKDQQVEEKRPSAPDQPARVDEYISPILRTPFSVFTLYCSKFSLQLPTFWLVCEDAHDIRQIAHTCEQKEEHTDALGALAAVVEEQLRHPRAKVERSAKIAEDLSP